MFVTAVDWSLVKVHLSRFPYKITAWDEYLFMNNGMNNTFSC